MNNALPRVGIVILNWNNYRATSRCLTSLQGINYANYTVYLVDNGSTDGSREKLIREFSRGNIEFVLNEKNLGFAAGCNRGIERALSEGCDYVLLLNNDTIVYDRDFLLHAVELAESDPRCGIVGGKILFWPDTTRIWSTGGYITFLGGEVHIGHGEIDRGQYDQVRERRFISGALMLIKREVIEAIGLLPEVYFFGKEEWEFSTRALRAGFKLLYNPKFSVYHEASNSHEWTDPTYVYNGTLSKIIYKRRNFSRMQYMIWYLLHTAYLRVLFPIKYFLQRKRYLQGVPPKVIRQAMLVALADARKVDRITGEMLDEFRKKYVRRDSL